MFVLHTSNKTENLLAHLVQVLSTPLSHPFKKEEFLIQSQGMERWLSQQLAERKAVWANFEFHFPGKFFGNIVDQLIDDHAKSNGKQMDISQEALVWYLDDLFHAVSDDENFEVLSDYIQGVGADLKRYQLAEKIAFLFDQYQFMRPDWLEAWQQNRLISSNPSEVWQKDLWLKLNRDGVVGKGSVWLSAISTLAEKKPSSVADLLPERLCVFGINGMSPIYLSFLQAIGEFIDVHFFLLNPTESYWADLPTKRQRAKLLADQPEGGTELFKTSNPLLSSLGQQGRDFQQLLLEQCDFKHEFNSFEKISNNNSGKHETLLANIQNDILGNTITDSTSAATLDSSLSIHSCHSRMRETEVLKDQLLKSLDADPSLSIRDVVVMTPDISLYAPYIAAVFEDISHAIADKNMLDSNNPLNIFINFLTLSQSRWELESVFEVLDQPVVHQKWGLIEADLESLRVWTTETNIRWGESAQHREEFGFPAFSENSWKAGLDRLLMGFANANDDQFCGNTGAGDRPNKVLPFAEIEGSQAQSLGGMYDFIHLLSQAKKTLSSSNTLSFWVDQLNYFAERLLSASDEFQQSYSALLDLINELDDYKDTHSNKVSLEVIIAWMTTAATKQQSGAGFLRGQLTFCSMLPMRAIPFKVIALMGMNEGEYPRMDARPAFDLMDDDFRKGDKSPRIDERYQFLEVILSAQQQLIMTYIGQSKSTNAAIPPSVVVSELLEVLDEHYLLDNMLNKPQTVVTRHRLQAYSPEYFSNSDSHFTYSSHQLLAANVLKKSSYSEPDPWWQGEIKQEPQTVIELNDLLAFYRHPQQHFVQQQLNISIPSLGTQADETEPFLLEGLSHYKIHQEWIERHMQDKDDGLDDDAFYKKIMAQGRWLSHSSGIISFEEHRLAIASFVEQLKAIDVGTRIDPIAIDIIMGDYRIVGIIENIYEQGALFYRYASMKGKDLLPVWITHLITQLVKPQHETWLLTKDEYWHFDHTTQEDSSTMLQQWVDYYRDGQQHPLALLTEPAMAWQRQKYKKNARISPLHSARDNYRKVFEYDPFFQLIYKNMSAEEVIDESFEQCCELLDPIWESQRE